VKKHVKGLDNVTFYEYHNSFWSAFGVENKSRDDLDVEMSCGKSENCLSSLSAAASRDAKCEVKVKAMKSKIGMFVAPANLNREWTVRCSVGV
jgi:hypothetical protein